MTTNTSLQVQAAPGSPTDGDQWYDATQKKWAHCINGTIHYSESIIFNQMVTKTIASSNTATSMFSTGLGSRILPANFWAVGKSIRIRTGGVFSTLLLPGNLTINLMHGATNIASAVITNLLASANGNAFQSVCTLTCRSIGATGQLISDGYINYDNGVLLRGTAALNNGGTPVTIDTTVQATIDKLLTWQTLSASNSISITTGYIEVLG